MKYAVYTLSGEGLPIAYRLHEEGQEVLVGMIEDARDILTTFEGKGKPEEPEEKKRRMSLYDGMLNKMSAKELTKKLLQEKNRSEWFIFFDFNHDFDYAEQLKGKGFHGNFPTEADRTLEVDRHAAKEFVKKHYPDLKVAEEHQFNTADEGITFLESATDAFVLKGMDEDAKTVVPDSDDPELAKVDIIDALKTDAPMYEKSGYILEKMISNVIELTPEMQFYNGKPLFTTMDIEMKRFGAGEQAIMTGCAGDLVFQTDMLDEINQIAFPKKVHQMAKAHEGWFVWDASILFDKKTGEAFFGEFCANRPGYNALYTEMSLVPSVHEFFEKIVAGENPLPEGEFAASIRAFNVQTQKVDDAPDMAEKKVSWDESCETQIWPMDVRACYGDEEAEGEPEEALETTGYSWDVAVTTGCGNDIQSAVKEAYAAMDSLRFKGKYIRPMHDFLSKSFPNSILNRYNYGKKRQLW